MYEIIFSYNIYFSILVGKINLNLAYVLNKVHETNAIDAKLKSVPLLYLEYIVYE